jgi:hypothetical protein
MYFNVIEFFASEQWISCYKHLRLTHGNGVDFGTANRHGTAWLCRESHGLLFHVNRPVPWAGEITTPSTTAPCGNVQSVIYKMSSRLLWCFAVLFCQ